MVRFVLAAMLVLPVLATPGTGHAASITVVGSGSAIASTAGIASSNSATGSNSVAGSVAVGTAGSISAKTVSTGDGTSTGSGGNGGGNGSSIAISKCAAGTGCDLVANHATKTVAAGSHGYLHSHGSAAFGLSTQ